MSLRYKTNKASTNLHLISPKSGFCWNNHICGRVTNRPLRTAGAAWLPLSGPLCTFPPGDRWYLSVAMERDVDREIEHAGISRCHAPRLRPGFTHAKQRRVPLPDLQEKFMQWNRSWVVKVRLTSDAINMGDIWELSHFEWYQTASYKCVFYQYTASS